LPAGPGSGRPYARLAVTDTGIGMDDHVKNHLFEPFFTTKPIGKGMGLGLSLAQSIAKQHGGELTLGEFEGHTCFSLTLPLRVEGQP